MRFSGAAMSILSTRSFAAGVTSSHLQREERRERERTVREKKERDP
jgi:hypothetical protein